VGGFEVRALDEAIERRRVADGLSWSAVATGRWDESRLVYAADR